MLAKPRDILQDLRPLDTKRQLTEKDPDAGKDWGQEEKEWQRM